MTRPLRLVLLRHGAAEPAGPATDHRDEPRTLTERGAEEVRRVARGLGALGVSPDVLLTSPLARCRQTAGIVAEVLGLTAREDRRIAPGMDLDLLADLLLEQGEAETVLVCGHQPDLSQVIADLTGGGAVRVGKATVAMLEVDALRYSGGRLEALLPPAVLGAAAGAGRRDARDERERDSP